MRSILLSLHKFLTNHFQIRKVDFVGGGFLNNTMITDDSAAIISTCLQNIEELNVAGCHLSKRGIVSICNGIKGLSVPVRKICLLGNAVANFDR